MVKWLYLEIFFLSLRLINKPIKKTAISKIVIQTREIKLIAIASGVGITVESIKVSTPSRTPNPEGAKRTTNPMIHDNV